MKANELMIGDWVRVTDACTGKSTPCKITSIWENEYVALDEDIDAADLPTNLLDPIPITSEILEKNGWKLVSDTPYKLEYLWSTGAVEEYADVRILIGKDHDNIWRWDFPILNIHFYRGDINLTKFSCLHELQHALRLCGIEHEITL